MYTDIPDDEILECVATKYNIIYKYDTFVLTRLKTFKRDKFMSHYIVLPDGRAMISNRL